MLDKIIFRPARGQDSLKIAQLTIVASGGMMEFLFDELFDEVSTEQILASVIEKEQDNLSYRNTIVVELKERVIAIANSYSATNHRITTEMRSFIPKERLELLEDFFDSRIDNSLFLNALSVEAEYRGQGIGKRLIQKVKRKAKSEGFSSVSLIVWTDNKRAISLYTSLGFQEVKQIEIGFHPLISHPGGATLMNCLVECLSFS